MFEGRKLERRLRAERPTPDEEFVTRLALRVNSEQRPVRSRARLRLGTALAVTLGAVAVAGATGGLSYAADAMSNSSASLVHAVGNAVAQPSSRPTTAAPTTSSTGSSTSVGSTSASSSNALVSAAADQYGSAWYCYKHGNQYVHQQGPSGNNGWILIWGPDFNGANRSCP